MTADVRRAISFRVEYALGRRFPERQSHTAAVVTLSLPVRSERRWSRSAGVMAAQISGKVLVSSIFFLFICSYGNKKTMLNYCFVIVYAKIITIFVKNNNFNNFFCYG